MSKKQRKQPSTPTISTKIEETSPFEFNQRWALALLFGSGFLVYVLGFSNKFLDWDDNLYVYQNPIVLEPLKHIKELFDKVVAGNYHPITMLSLALNSLLFGKNPTSFIVTNAFIHAANACLVFIFIKKLTNNTFFVAFFAALFFAIHPMHVESVVWISERKDVLYVFFFLASCITYLQYLNDKTTKLYALTFLLFILSCLSKAQAVVLPFVLILIDYYVSNEPIRLKNFTNKIPFFIASLLFGMIAMDVQSGGTFHGLFSRDIQDTAMGNIPFLNRSLFALYGLALYFLKFFVPLNLHNLYPVPLFQNFYAPSVLLGAIFGVSIVLSIIYFYKVNKRALFFGFSFFLICLVLVLQFISVGAAFFAERYSYLPYVGLSFAVFSFLANYYPKQIKSLSSVLGFIALLFVILTMRYTTQWKNEFVMWQNTYEIEKANPHILIAKSLMNEYGKKGELDKVIEVGNNYRENIDAIAPPVYANLANAYMLKQDFTTAMNLLNQAQDNSSPKDSTGFLKILSLKQTINSHLGKQEDALKNIDAKLALVHTQPPKDFLMDKATILRGLNRFQEANQIYDEIIARGVSNDTLFNDKAVALSALGKNPEAIVFLKKAQFINPNNPDVISNLKKLGQ